MDGDAVAGVGAVVVIGDVDIVGVVTDGVVTDGVVTDGVVTVGVTVVPPVPVLAHAAILIANAIIITNTDTFFILI